MLKISFKRQPTGAPTDLLLKSQIFFPYQKANLPSTTNVRPVTVGLWLEP
jgi:hypothetical protein